MGKYMKILIIGLILSFFSFFPQRLGLLAGDLGVYTGTLNFMCTEGDNPIEKIVFQFEENMGNTLMVYKKPTGWDCIHFGDRIELRNGQLDPGVPIQLVLSCKWYMWEGSYTFTSIGTTTIGQTVMTQGVLGIPDMMLLQVLFHLTNPLFRVFVFGATLVFAFLEISSRRAAASVSENETNTT
jgi:hypothetical protein